MTPSPGNPPPSLRPHRSRFLRFSLRSLLVLVLLLGTIGLTIRNWEPWVLEKSFESGILSPKATRALVPEGTFSTTVWDAEHLRKLQSHPFKIEQCIFSKYSHFAAVFSDMEEWYVLDLADGKKMSKLTGAARLNAGCFSPDSERVAGINRGGKYAVFDTHTGREICELKARVPISNCAITHINNNLLLVASVKDDTPSETWVPTIKWILAESLTGRTTLCKDVDIEKAVANISQYQIAGHFPKSPSFADGRFLEASGNFMVIRNTDRDVLCKINPLGDIRRGTTDKFVDYAPLFSDATYFILDHENRLLIRQSSSQINRFYVYYNRYPEQLWGVAWMPEFRAAAFLLLALLWSIIRDSRTIS